MPTHVETRLSMLKCWTVHAGITIARVCIENHTIITTQRCKVEKVERAGVLSKSTSIRSRIKVSSYTATATPSVHRCTTQRWEVLSPRAFLLARRPQRQSPQQQPGSMVVSSRSRESEERSERSQTSQQARPPLPGASTSGSV